LALQGSIFVKPASTYQLLKPYPQTISKTLKQDQHKPPVRGKPSNRKPAGTKELQKLIN